MEFFPGDIVNNGYSDYTVAEYLAGGTGYYNGPVVKYSEGNWDPASGLTLVSRVSEPTDWETVTQDEVDLLNRLGIEYTSRLQIKIKGEK